MTTRRLLSLLIGAASVILPTGGSVALSRLQCDADWVCVRPVRDRSRLNFYVENLKPVPLTLTLRIDASGTLDARRRTITATLEGYARENLITMTARDDGASINYDYRFDWAVGRRDARHDHDALYRLPYASGQSYRVVQGYGSRFSHTGLEEFAVDFAMPEGTPIHAARDGRVARVVEFNNRACWGAGCAKYANFVIVLHDDGTTSEYYHLQQDGALVEEGELVVAGQKIARSGNTGNSTMPHLHFGVYRAASWGNTQSIPVRFASASGLIDRPISGRRYTAD